MGFASILTSGLIFGEYHSLFALETQNESLIVGAKAQLGVI